MSQEDFDIDELAAFLHLTPSQVMRMADRGQLPGRKIGGKWRFSQAEIHHWFEERIGASDEAELVEVEGVLRRHADEKQFSLRDLFLPTAIAVPLQARSRRSVIRAMAELAANAGVLWDPDKMAEAVLARENLHPTALDNGVALLHPRRPLPGILAQAFIAVGVIPAGVPFGGSRGVLTRIFFLICSTDDPHHLRTLARLSRLIALPNLLSQIESAPDPATIYHLLCEADEQVED